MHHRNNIIYAVVKKLKASGFTLIEMLLVMVIVGMVLMMSIAYFQQQTLNTRIARTSSQMQQILNAGMAFFVANGYWPSALSNLQGTYLPSGSITSPWGGPYLVSSPTTNPITPGTPPLLYVWTTITAGDQSGSIANVIAGQLTLAYTTESSSSNNQPPADDKPCTAASTSCTVVSMVNIPGQNLNNATAVNYAGLYHSGSCVPVPSCPVDPKSGITMIPEIIVVPVSISGVSEAPTGSGCSPSNLGACAANVYPLSSFTAFARGPSPLGTGITACSGSGTGPCYSTGTTPISNSDPQAKYWRVCLSATTDKGTVAVTPSDPSNKTSAAWGELVGTILAFTRCSIPNENTGSDFTVWAP